MAQKPKILLLFFFPVKKKLFGDNTCNISHYRSDVIVVTQYTVLNLSNEKGAQREFPNAAAISYLLNPFIILYKYTAGKYYRVWVKTKYFGFQTFRIHKGSSGKQCLISKESESLKTFSERMISFRLIYNIFLNLKLFNTIINSI